MSPEAATLDDSYDALARSHYWHPEALFGLVYAYLKPEERLLDVGIGTGLASEPFAKAGLRVYGLDADPDVLAVCRAKSLAVDLREHDLLDVPWPYEAATFHHVLACGVLHFVADLAPVFAEIRRLLRPRGTFTFTTKAPPAAVGTAVHQDRPFAESIQGVTLYSHTRSSLDNLTTALGFVCLKELRLVIRTGRGSDDLFYAFVTRLGP
jgi:SAM-dependent methyltransferase